MKSQPFDHQVSPKNGRLSILLPWHITPAALWKLHSNLQGSYYYQLVLFSYSVMCESLQPVDCGLPGSSLLGIPQARILEWVAVSFPRFLPDPWVKPTSPVSPALAGGFFTTEPPVKLYYYQYPSSYRGRFRGSERLRNLPKVTAPKWHSWHVNSGL